MGLDVITFKGKREVWKNFTKQVHTKEKRTVWEVLSNLIKNFKS